MSLSKKHNHLRFACAPPGLKTIVSDREIPVSTAVTVCNKISRRKDAYLQFNTWVVAKRVCFRLITCMAEGFDSLSAREYSMGV